MNGSRVLIIGCGYLGMEVARRLRARGVEVAGTTARPERVPELAAAGVRPVLLDLARPDASEAWGLRPDAVLYAVAPGRGGDPDLAFRRGAILAAERLHAAQESTPGRLVYVSTTGVYHQRDGSWVDETSPAESSGERHGLIRDAERALLALSGCSGPPVVIVRLGGLYGPGRSPIEWLRRPEMLERLVRGGREAYMNWVRVEDAAEAAVRALAGGRPGETYLAVDDGPVRRGEFYRRAAEIAGIPRLEFPSRPEDLGKRCSNRKAREELGWTPSFPTYREGLADLEV